MVPVPYEEHHAYSGTRYVCEALWKRLPWS